jgi:hypothetical protein
VRRRRLDRLTGDTDPWPGPHRPVGGRRARRPRHLLTPELPSVARLAVRPPPVAPAPGLAVGPRQPEEKRTYGMSELPPRGSGGGVRTSSAMTPWPDQGRAGRGLPPTP